MAGKRFALHVLAGIGDAFRGSICFRWHWSGFQFVVCRFVPLPGAHGRWVWSVLLHPLAASGILSCWMTVVRGTELGDAASLAARGQAKQKMCALSENQQFQIPWPAPSKQPASPPVAR
jgi:hypothetical protein